MKVLINFLTEAILCASLLFCIACSSREKKEVADNQPIASCGETRMNDAQFIGSALEQGYVILELAELAKSKSASQHVSDQAQVMITEQLHVVYELREYALANHIVIPIGAPERARQAVKRLNAEVPDTFDRAWMQEIARLNLKLVKDFESYKRDAAQPMAGVIQESLATLRIRHDALGKYIATNQPYN